MATKNSTIAKNTIFLSLRMIFVLFISLYTSRVFLNVLGIVDYGISNVVTGFVSMFGFLNTSLANGIQRFYNSELGHNTENGVKKVYNTSLVIQAMIAFVVAVMLESLGLWYMFNKMVIPEDRFWTAFWIYQCAAISSVVVIMQSPYSAAIMAYERMNVYAIFSIFDVLFKLVFALALPYIAIDRLLMYGVFYLVASLIGFLLNYFYCKCELGELKLGRYIDKGMFKSMLSFSGWNMFGTFACMVREQGLNLVLNLFFGPVINAARGIAYQVTGALQGFVSNISLAAKPQMVQSYATGDSSRTMTLMYAMSKLSYLILFVLSLPIILNIDYILILWLGNTVPDKASIFVVLVVLNNFMNNLNAPLSNVVYATGKMRNYELVFSLVNLSIIPISFFVLDYGAPAESAFVTYFIMSILVQICCLFVLKTIVNISIRSYFLKLILPLLLTSVISCTLLIAVHSLLPHNLIGIFVEYVFVFLETTLFFYFICLNNTEKKNIINLVKKVIKR